MQCRRVNRNVPTTAGNRTAREATIRAPLASLADPLRTHALLEEVVSAGILRGNVALVLGYLLWRDTKDIVQYRNKTKEHHTTSTTKNHEQPRFDSMTSLDVAALESNANKLFEPLLRFSSLNQGTTAACLLQSLRCHRA